MNRICILGPCAAGKSTLATRLGEVTGIAVTHLDALYWLPGWVEKDRAAFLAEVDAVVAGDRWIIDGNYSRTFGSRLPRSDLVVILHVSRWICLWRAIKRCVVYRKRTRPDMGAGCPEKIDREFVWWIMTYPNRHPDPVAEVKGHAPDARVVSLRSKEEIERFLADVNSAL